MIVSLLLNLSYFYETYQIKTFSAPPDDKELIKKVIFS